MKTKTNKRVLISAIGIALIILLGAIYSIPMAGVAFAEAKSNRIVNEMEAFENKTMNQRLYTLTSNHIATNMNRNSSIATTKQLVDFAGNRYVLFELSPKGYIIYHIDSGKFVEYSEDSFSPYLGYSSNLCYGGGMQYYYLQEDKFFHTIKHDLSFPQSSVSELCSDSQNMSDNFCVHPSSENLNFINKGTPLRRGVEEIKGVAEKREQLQTRSTSPRISMTDFFPRLITTDEIGYRDNGCCGYIATNLIIGYNYFAYDYGLINNSSYVDFTNKTMNGTGLTDRLLTLAGQDPEADYIPGTYSYNMFVVLGSYFDEISNYRPWTLSWYFLSTNVKSTLDDGYPVVLFGSLPDPDGISGNINHAVVAYDYANYGFLNLGTKYRVHFGWSGCASIWLESPTIGSNCFMKIS